MSTASAPVYEQTSDAFKKRFMWRLIIVLTGGMLLDGYILGVIGPVTPALAEDLGLTSTQIGLIAAMALLGILIGSPLRASAKSVKEAVTSGFVVVRTVWRV